MRIKNRKKTLIISILTIALCFSFLVGVTLALFTNSSSDGTIGINTAAGFIDVEILDSKNESLIGDVLRFKGEEEGKTLYWEPGATFHTEAFKIKNTGSVSINYQIFINSGSGDDELLDVLEFWVTDNVNSLEEAVELPSYKGSLAKDGESKDYYLVVHMKEEAGNKYQNLKLTGVGITVYAVQGNLEIQ